jgi:hypothetical protein
MQLLLGDLFIGEREMGNVAVNWEKNNFCKHYDDDGQPNTGEDKNEEYSMLCGDNIICEALLERREE